MELVNGVTIVHNLEPAHHVTRNTGLLLISYLLAHRVVLPHRLPHLVVVVPLRLQPPLYRLHIVFPVRTCPRPLKRNLFGVRLSHLTRNRLLFKQFREIWYKLLKRDGPDALGLQSGYAHFPQNSNLYEHPPQNFVHPP